MSVRFTTGTSSSQTVLSLNIEDRSGIWSLGLESDLGGLLGLLALLASGGSPVALLGPDPIAAADGANNADADSSIAVLALLGPDPDPAADGANTADASIAMLALLGPDPDAAADGANNADADSSIAMLALLGPDPDSAADPCMPIPMFVSSSESGNTITGPGTSALTDPVKASDSTFG